MKDICRINLWSGPRNISTAMMYSFAQRSDTEVVDEPLYAHYLRVSGAQHPGRDEVLASQEKDGSKVIRKMLSDDWTKPVVFFKQMTHHLIDLPLDFLSRTKNILLIRDPKEVLISYSRVIAQPSLEDIGIRQSYELWNFLEMKNFHHVVLDSNEVLRNPKKVLTETCRHVRIEFEKSMLHWTAGARPEDGVWAKYWYKNVHRSTGFAPFKKEEKNLPERLMKVYEEGKPFYDFLYEQRLKK
ncbi:MAG TPA: hypothetical protein VE978_22030 [Chitinophagales bacterium]|nr:hypothetical protein [Chitinophagales bacterium]